MSFAPVIARKFGTVAHCVSELFKQAGGIQRVMVRLGIKQSVAYGYTEENTDAELSLARAAALSDPTCTAVAEFFAGLCGGVFCPLSCKEGDGTALAAEEMRANGEAMADVIKALNAGKLSLASAAKALPEVEEALCDMAALRGLLLTTLETKGRG